MLLIAVAVVVTLAVLVMTLAIRDKDLPPVEPLSPFIHLDERKARIYENLRDLQFELRLGKLSDEDYASSKKALQQELAQVLAETEAMKASLQKKTA